MDFALPLWGEGGFTPQTPWVKIISLESLNPKKHGCLSRMASFTEPPWPLLCSNFMHVKYKYSQNTVHIQN